MQVVKSRRDGALAWLAGGIPYVQFLGIGFDRRGDELTAYLPTAEIMGGEPIVSDSPDTGFVSLPDRITGRCRSTDDFTWLEVAVDRTGLPGAPDLTEGRDPAWGLHNADVSIALGDLVDLVAAQSAAWVERGGVASASIG